MNGPMGVTLWRVAVVYAASMLVLLLVTLGFVNPTRLVTRAGSR